MKRTVLILLVIIGMTLLGGCLSMNDENSDRKNDNETNQTNSPSYENNDRYVSVQEYTGEGYTLANGKENDRIANDNREVIEEAVKDFFQEEYKTEVSVHQIVGNKDGATVFVESVGEPHFYTYAVIPINQATKEIETSGVWSQERQIEDAIIASIYGLVFEEQFQNLTQKIEKLSENYNLTGLNKKAIPVGANRFSNQYYFVSIFDEKPYKKLLESYLDNPNRSKEYWRNILDGNNINIDSISIAINLYMEKGEKPSNEAFQAVIKTIEHSKEIPKGLYSVFLHNNYINKKRATGYKINNSLERSNPNYIEKK
ncbi:hypothetical protein J416_04176 [Gracilibacillus halophilus YIM-C55.5]|uniref:Lipoprotein n=1 Tax=Gracilibacillus halophilus YIM-C55.5 TaxID=1308866 RepID=N4WXB8_9BACI|nr:DUF1672 family protein [Gracilibacillus halophilus]ENH97731.1 hypothetical protein J416_04176 [Gracilibacillus halophilus YIM-C55.5]